MSTNAKGIGRAPIISALAVIEGFLAVVSVAAGKLLWDLERFFYVAIVPTSDDPNIVKGEFQQFLAWESVIGLYGILCMLASYGLWKRKKWSRGLAASLSAIVAAALTVMCFDLSFYQGHILWLFFWPALAFYGLTLLFFLLSDINFAVRENIECSNYD